MFVRKPRWRTNCKMFLIDGVFYTFSPGFGCQLESNEWKRVPAGTERVIKSAYGDSIVVRVNSADWDKFMWRTTWEVSPSGTIDEHHTRIRELENILNTL